MANAFAVTAFESKLRAALQRVRLVLDTERAPQLASEIHHRYQDKYVLAECLTNSAVASQVNCLASLGLRAEHLEQLASWAGAGTAVSLCFELQTSCTHDRTETREVESPESRTVEKSAGGRVVAALTSKVTTKVEEHFWKTEGKYHLFATRGVGAVDSDRISLLQRTSGAEMKTSSAEVAPHAGRRTTQQVNISWLVKQLETPGFSPGFKVDRAHTECHTPRRNADVQLAAEHFGELGAWVNRVLSDLSVLFDLQADPALKGQVARDVKACQEAVLIPVLPLLGEASCEPGESQAEPTPSSTEVSAPGVVASLASSRDSAGSRVLAMRDANRLLAEELRALGEQRACLAQSSALPAGDAPGGAGQAAFSMTLEHCRLVGQQWSESLDYIERLLRRQLVAAIGKEVTPADFAQYMGFHNRKVFRAPFAPVPFCFGARRSEHHDPEGTVSLEEQEPGSCILGSAARAATPVATLTSKCAAEAAPDMRFALGASTFVTFRGDRHLHAWLSHRFGSADTTGSGVSLVARARQFSSMIVLVGRIASASCFEPRCAAIVQNRDELSVPLDLATIPTAREFQDAIESLSPEQQDFAKAFRAMQLESTLFGVLVIHIKPQMEAVLNLPPDSLTKEIKLTQDLMQLFVKHQIPSDLLSCSAPGSQRGAGGAGAGDLPELVGGASAAERLSEVKAHVKAMKELIEDSQKEEVQQRTLEARYAAPELLQRNSERYVLECDDEDCEESMDFDLFDGCAESAPAPVRVSALRREAAPPGPTAFSAAGAACRDAPAPGPPAAPEQPSGEPQWVPECEDAAAAHVRDYTRVPGDIDARFEKLCPGGTCRPTIISPAKVWRKRAQKALLAKPSETSLGASEQKREKDAAFDLLDALTKSGALPVEHASLHVVVAATHCFDQTLLETVVQGGSNPIESVERSTLIMASAVHQLPAAALIQESQRPRISSVSPALFLDDGGAEAGANGAAAAP